MAGQFGGQAAASEAPEKASDYKRLDDAQNGVVSKL
jgi:hypothetical protein